MNEATAAVQIPLCTHLTADCALHTTHNSIDGTDSWPAWTSNRILASSTVVTGIATHASKAQQY